MKTAFEKKKERASATPPQAARSKEHGSSEPSRSFIPRGKLASHAFLQGTACGLTPSASVAGSRHIRGPPGLKQPQSAQMRLNDRQRITTTGTLPLQIIWCSVAAPEHLMFMNIPEG